MPSSSRTSAVASTDRTSEAPGAIELPAWAAVSEKRRAHIARVTALLDQWARELRLDADEARAWHDAGRWHDALLDAGEEELRRGVEQIFGDQSRLPLAARREYKFQSPTGGVAGPRRAAWDKALAGATSTRLSDAARAFEQLTKARKPPRFLPTANLGG